MLKHKTGRLSNKFIIVSIPLYVVLDLFDKSNNLIVSLIIFDFLFF